MNIAILPQGNERNLTGVNKVTVGTMRELLKIDKSNHYFLLGDGRGLSLDLDTIKVPYADMMAFPLNYTAYTNELDIVHSYYPAFHISPKLKCGKILMIHDLIPFVFPEYVGGKSGQYNYFANVIRKNAEEADIIIANSKYTKSDILKYYSVSEEKVKVVYCGLYSEGISKKNEKKINGIDEKGYILSVSALAMNKNQEGLLKAFFRFKEKNQECNLKLVLTGPIRQSAYINTILAEYSEYIEDVIFTGYVSEEELAWLYKNALAFIYVSFYEGFGLPILEALSMEKAVICSNTSSMPEVGGDAVEYCNPHDIESIEAAMEKVILHKEHRIALEGMAREQAAKFSFAKAARETLEIYKYFE